MTILNRMISLMVTNLIWSFISLPQTWLRWARPMFNVRKYGMHGTAEMRRGQLRKDGVAVLAGKDTV